MKPAKRPPEGKIKGEIRYDAPMAEYTSFRVGGPADCLAFPRDREDLLLLLRWCREEEVPYLVFGNGTNLLVRDGGIRGLAINLSRGFHRLEQQDRNPEGALILAEAGESLGKFVDYCCRHELTGLEFAAGIPGSVGGAIFMNAGAFRREMKDVLRAIFLLDESGRGIERRIEETKASYRTMGIQKGEVILGGRFFLGIGKGEEIRKKVAETVGKRYAKQPYDLPNAGSVFKNPAQAPAGMLIEEAGLKGVRVGGAQVSEKHANFIVNVGRATARDILELVEKVRETVLKKKSVLLEMEIQVVGEKEG